MHVSLYFCHITNGAFEKIIREIGINILLTHISLCWKLVFFRKSRSLFEILSKLVSYKIEILEIEIHQNFLRF